MTPVQCLVRIRQHSNWTADRHENQISPPCLDFTHIKCEMTPATIGGEKQVLKKEKFTGVVMLPRRIKVKKETENAPAVRYSGKEAGSIWEVGRKSMSIFVQSIINGLNQGAIYALIALGYTMVYGILRLINFAHGDVFMVAGMMLIWFSSTMPVTVAIPMVIIITIILGFCIERAAYLPLRNAPRMSVMISAIGVSYLLQNVITYLTGGQPMTYPTIPMLASTVGIFGTKQTIATIITLPTVIILVVLLTFLINHTKVGMAMRAVSKDFETSRLMGIKINNVISVTFVIGSALAAVGSVLYFSNYPKIVAVSGALPGLKAFVAAVFGGIGSIPGAVIGAFVIGICENLIKSTPYSVFSDAFTFAVLVVVLIFRPTGIFGEKTVDKV